MTITAEQIPDEAIETAARMAFTYYKSLPWDECAHKMLWCRLARIALLGGLNAWPGLELVEPFSPTPGRGLALRIPLPQKEPRT